MQDEGKQQNPLSSTPSSMAGTFIPQPGTPNRPHKARIFSVVNVVVAVLLIGVIAGTSLFFWRQHTAMTATTTGNSLALTLPTTQNCLFNNYSDDVGLTYVCQHHLYQAVRGTASVSGMTVTIKQGYADMNRVALAYTVQEGKHDVTRGTQVQMALVAQGGIASGNVFENTVVENSGVASFEPTRALEDLKTLNLQLKIGQFGVPLSALSPVITFSLPLHTEQHLLNTPQKVTANGIDLTYKGGSISLSQANFSFVFSQDLLSIHAIVGPFSLTVNNTNIRCGASGSGIRTTYILQFYCPLFSEHGRWTVQVTARNMQGGSTLAPWTFTFDVP